MEGNTGVEEALLEVVMDGRGGLIVGACALAHCATFAFVSRHMYIARISLQTGPAYANIALK